MRVVRAIVFVTMLLTPFYTGAAKAAEQRQSELELVVFRDAEASAGNAGAAQIRQHMLDLGIGVAPDTTGEMDIQKIPSKYSAEASAIIFSRTELSMDIRHQLMRLAWEMGKVKSVADGGLCVEQRTAGYTLMAKTWEFWYPTGKETIASVDEKIFNDTLAAYQEGKIESNVQKSNVCRSQPTPAPTPTRVPRPRTVNV